AGEMALAVERGDSAQFVELNASFHHLIHDECGSHVLKKLLSMLWSGWGVAAPIYVPGRMTESHNEHLALIEALRSGDGDSAATLMQKHVEGAHSAYADS